MPRARYLHARQYASIFFNSAGLNGFLERWTSRARMRSENEWMVRGQLQ